MATGQTRTLEEERRKYEEEVKKAPSPLDNYSFYSRFIFGWCSPIIKAAKKFGLSIEMLPNLSHEFQHKNYSNKIRFHVNNLIQEAKEKKLKPSKYMILKLLFRTFKFDIFLTLVLMILLILLEYSSPYFLLKILSIPKVYEKSLHLIMFAQFSTGMIITKILTSIANDNVYFQMVF